jgi:hypothetical protein
MRPKELRPEWETGVNARLEEKQAISFDFGFPGGDS